jgi:hypothetical protein
MQNSNYIKLCILVGLTLYIVACDVNPFSLYPDINDMKDHIQRRMDEHEINYNNYIKIVSINEEYCTEKSKNLYQIKVTCQYEVIRPCYIEIRHRFGGSDYLPDLYLNVKKSMFGMFGSCKLLSVGQQITCSGAEFFMKTNNGWEVKDYSGILELMIQEKYQK